ncbi:MAG TPA: adenylate/guanylate cyclase domain-containing protein [Candidatus Limnocylindrales bacterium]|nr:adenylate/guanylate cyclase domain-containing protein [Candidatus Limnocylindrales bacterium]
MTTATSQAGRAARALSPRATIWLFHLSLPIAGLWLLVANPSYDVAWEDHGAHFSLILTVALVNVLLAALVGSAAHRRGDARLFLVSLAFAAAAGFFALHAFVTPAVVLQTPSASFVLSSPVGIVLAGAFGLASAGEFDESRAAVVLRWRARLIALVVVALVAWVILSLIPGSPLNRPLAPDDAQPILRALAIAGVALHATAALAYVDLYRRRPSVVVIAIVTAFVLLGEALVAMAESRSWHASWWEWHVLLLLGFGYVAYSAHVQYRREGRATALFGALSLDETVRRLRDEYATALDGLVDAMESAGETGRSAAVEPEAARFSARFGLSEGQADVLVRAAEALAVERREVRKLGLFRRYLSPEVSTALLADPTQAALGGATVDVSVLFADLRGFTSFSERSEPSDVVALLNAYFGEAVPEILGNGGTVVQFMGDALMAIFNAPVRQADHELRAARAALAIQRRAAAIADGHAEWPRFRVGVASGPALVGNVGSDEVRSFTAIGDTVNLAARLQAQAAVGTVVVSARTAAALARRAALVPIGELRLKGKARPVEAFELRGLVGDDRDAATSDLAAAPEGFVG